METLVYMDAQQQISLDQIQALASLKSSVSNKLTVTAFVQNFKLLLQSYYTNKAYIKHYI